MARPYENMWDTADDLAPFEGTPKTYVIASTPRSGSHYLAFLLHDTGVLGYPLEYFNPAQAKGWAERCEAVSPDAVTRAIMARRTSAQGWFGVKTHWRQFRDAVTKGAAAPILAPRFIRIMREDRIAQAVSLAIASQTKSRISGMEPTGEPRYEFDRIQKMERLIDDETGGWDGFLADHDHLTLVYEELCADPDGGVRQVADFLGVALPRPAGFTSRAQRQAGAVNGDFRDRYLIDSGRA